MTDKPKTDSRCDYFSLPSGWCEKCGNEHDGKVFTPHTPESSERPIILHPKFTPSQPTPEISTDEKHSTEHLIECLEQRMNNKLQRLISDRLRTLSDEVGKKSDWKGLFEDMEKTAIKFRDMSESLTAENERLKKEVASKNRTSNKMVTYVDELQATITTLTADRDMLKMEVEDKDESYKIRVKQLTANLTLATDALEELSNKKHLYLEDSYYSCPKEESEGCSNDAETDDCNCGTDRHNQIIDTALTSLKGSQG